MDKIIDKIKILIGKFNKLEKKKKNIIIAIVAALLIIGILDSYPEDYAEATTETTNTSEQVETTEIVVEETNETEEVAIEEEPSSEVTPTPVAVDLTIDTELGFGEFIVGEDIEAGTYVCTVNPGEDITGSVSVYGKLEEGGALGTDEYQEGADSVQITVEEGDTIKITGISSVHFEPLN